MALSKYEIQKRSNEKLGLKMRGYRLPAETVDDIANLAKAAGISQAALIIAAIAAYKEQQGIM